MKTSKTKFPGKHKFTVSEIRVISFFILIQDRYRISEKLHITINTLNVHFQNIYQKWNIHSDAQLIITALHNGFDLEGNYLPEPYYMHGQLCLFNLDFLNEEVDLLN